MPDLLTPEQFAQSIKAKYPDYASVPDAELAAKMLEKYPEYRSRVQTPAPAMPEPSWREKQSQANEDVLTGLVKGAGQTAVNLGKMVHKIPGVSRAVDALYGTPGLSQNAFQSADQALSPTNTTQKVGKMTEQVAETIVPSQVMQQAGITAAERLAPRLTQSLGPVIARVLPRAAVEAAGSAGMSAAQGGSPVVGAVLGAVSPVVGEMLGGAPAALRDTAETKVVQALGPTKERFKAIANRLAPQILQRGLGGSREALQQQAATTLETVGEQLDGALKQYGEKAITTQPVIDALETAKDAFRTTTTMPLRQAMAKNLLEKATAVKDGMAVVPIEFEPRAIKQLDGLQGIIGDLGDTATVEQLTAIRRAWDKVVSQAGGYAQRAGGAIGVPLKDQSEAWAKREASGAIRRLLADQVPDLAAINKEYSFWKNLDDVLTQTLQRTQPQGPGLGKQMAEMAGQAVGGVAGSSAGPGGAVGGAFALGKVAKMAESVFASPRWKFVDAGLRNALADSIANGRTGQAASILSRISAVQASKIPDALATTP